MPENQPTYDLTVEQARAWLGAPRFAAYVSAAGGDETLGLRLYRWNSQAAAAALVDAGHFEVALRNAYDRHLVQRFPNWAVDEASPLFQRPQGQPRARQAQATLNERSLRELTAAKRGLGSRPSHGQVVANLSFGFWAQMTHRARTSTFWTPTLRHAYPAEVRGQSRHIHDLVQNVVGFRNRLAHGERVFSTSTGLVDRLDEMTTLFRMIHPEAAAWTAQHSTVQAVLDTCPVAGLMPTARGRGPMTAAQVAALSANVSLGASRPRTATTTAQQQPHNSPTRRRSRGRG